MPHVCPANHCNCLEVNPFSKPRKCPASHWGTLYFATHRSLCRGFSVSTFSAWLPLYQTTFPPLVKKNIKAFPYTLVTVLLCGCSLFGLAPIHRYCHGSCFHFIDENTEAQRTPCRHIQINGKAKTAAWIFWCQSLLGNLLCEVADEPIQHDREGAKGKGKCP